MFREPNNLNNVNIIVWVLKMFFHQNCLLDEAISVSEFYVT